MIEKPVNTRPVFVESLGLMIEDDYHKALQRWELMANAYGALRFNPFDSTRAGELRRAGYVPDVSARVWHHDGPAPHMGKDYDMIIWSNEAPTEIRVPSNSFGECGIYTPEPYEVIRFNNANVMHRYPEWLAKHIEKVRGVALPEHEQMTDRRTNFSGRLFGKMMVPRKEYT